MRMQPCDSALAERVLVAGAVDVVVGLLEEHLHALHRIVGMAGRLGGLAARPLRIGRHPRRIPDHFADLEVAFGRRIFVLADRDGEASRRRHRPRRTLQLAIRKVDFETELGDCRRAPEKTRKCKKQKTFHARSYCKRDSISRCCDRVTLDETASARHHARAETESQTQRNEPHVIICICRGKSERDIARAIDNGAIHPPRSAALRHRRPVRLLPQLAAGHARRSSSRGRIALQSRARPAPLPWPPSAHAHA